MAGRSLRPDAIYFTVSSDISGAHPEAERQPAGSNAGTHKQGLAAFADEAGGIFFAKTRGFEHGGPVQQR
jgi:hypothetical protein